MNKTYRQSITGFEYLILAQPVCVLELAPEGYIVLGISQGLGLLEIGMQLDV